MAESIPADRVVPRSESATIAFKSGDARPEQVAAAVCAFLNSDGGSVYVGISADGSVRGVENAEELAATLRVELQERIAPKALWSVGVDRVGEHQVIAIDVPTGAEKPYVCDGSIYVRQGGGEVVAVADEIFRLVEERHRAPRRWERQPAAGLEVDDLDQNEIRRAIEEIRQTQRFEIDTAVDSTEFLYELSLMQSGMLTNAGALLFAENPSRLLPQARVRATAFLSDKGGDFLDDEVFEGNLFALARHIMAFFQRNLRVAAEFVPGELQRVTRAEYPTRALREGVMNALAHRDYSAFDGGMSIGIYPDRIEIWNSGRLPEGLTVEALKQTHPSVPANPDIAHVLYLRGFIERIGRGTTKIVEECRHAGLPDPVWSAGPLGVTLTLFARRSTSAE